MKGLLLLFQFMTRLPIPVKVEYDADEVGKSMKFFPIVGILIGGILWGTYLVLSKYINSPYALASLIVLLEIILTGGLHLDGLADTFDGIFSYRSKHRMLEIMKDSRLGSNGALALIVYFLLKISLIAEVGFAIILIMPVIARLNSVLNAAIGPYARATGMGKSIVEHTTAIGVVISTVLTSVYVYFIGWHFGEAYLGFRLLAIIPLVMLPGAYFAKLMDRKIGGVTGDTLGAVLEMTEILVIFFAAIIL
ncbi:adenosylcobinamide-GDP ribazoletransferase [uncultured Ilyobacter sp.]|uniref:adenosylcobinamide-GDP ribazoletransferase n=1 Tax=uncultured Ilyobacter sp. TaxID=544433 RepID=UPI0029C8F99D|nr:adenosylcobinamide-GDP ribazoletransferase [uncultured Ilyobacter sp.]